MPLQSHERHGENQSAMKDLKEPQSAAHRGPKPPGSQAGQQGSTDPSPPPPPTDPTATVTHRLHLGGFRDAITSADLTSRFSSFGQVTDVVIPTSDTGLPRGFAHFTLTGTHAQYTRLLSVYNGTKWKGGVISLRPAKPRPETIRQLERDQVAERERARQLNFGPGASKDVMPLEGGWPQWVRAQAQERRRARRGALEGKHVGWIDLTMADDAKHLDLAGKHRLWKRVKFGRVLPVMRRLRTPLGPITMNPSQMRDGFERLYGSAKSGKRVEGLTWEIPEMEEEEEKEEQQDKGKSADYWEAVEREMRRVNGEQFVVGENQDGQSDTDGDEEDDDQADADTMDVDEHTASLDEPEMGSSHETQERATKSMFSDDDADGSNADVEMDDGDDDERFEYKEQFVGEKGKQLLALQKKAKGDDRFKITSDFAPDASDHDDSDAEPDFFDSLPRSSSSPAAGHDDGDHPALDENDENAAKNVRKERSMAMSLLAGMFGAEATREAVDHARLQSKGLKPTGGDRTFELTGMVFYDPMDVSASKYEIAAPVVEEEHGEEEEPSQAKTKSQAKKKTKGRKKYSFESSSEEEDSSSDEDASDKGDAMDVDSATAAPASSTSGISSLFAEPIVSTDSATVHADFSSIFTRGGPSMEASAFSLFGAGGTTSDVSSSDSDSDSDSEKEARPFFASLPSAAKSAAAAATAGTSKSTGARPITLASPYLFLTLDRLAAAETKSFVRTRADADVKQEWLGTRWELMSEVRKRHKNAARKAKQRAVGRMAARGGGAVGGGRK